MRKNIKSVWASISCENIEIILLKDSVYKPIFGCVRNYLLKQGFLLHGLTIHASLDYLGQEIRFYTFHN